MEFIVCKMCKKGHIGGYSGYVDRRFLENINDEQEAICEAQQFARDSTEGCVVGLFVREKHATVRAIRGWKKIKGDELRIQQPKDIQNMFHVTSHTFDQVKPGSGDL